MEAIMESTLVTVDQYQGALCWYLIRMRPKRLLYNTILRNHQLSNPWPGDQRSNIGYQDYT